MSKPMPMRRWDDKIRHWGLREFLSERSVRIVLCGVLLMLITIGTVVAVMAFYKPPPPWREEPGTARLLNQDGEIAEAYRAGDNLTVRRGVCILSPTPLASVRRWLQASDGTKILLSSGPSVRRPDLGCTSEKFEIAIPIDTRPGDYQYRTEADLPVMCIGPGWCLKLVHLELEPLPLRVLPNDIIIRLVWLETTQLKAAGRIKQLEAAVHALDLKVKMLDAQVPGLRERQPSGWKR